MENYNENDQLAELRAFWNEYGRALVFGVIFSLGTFGAWSFWSGHQTQQAEQASDLYYTMMEAYDELAQELEQTNLPLSEQNSSNSPVSLETLAKFQNAVSDLKASYGGSEYAHYAALQQAKYYIEVDNLESAEKELQGAIKHAKNEELTLLTQLRLARVQFALKKYESALAHTNQKNLGSYTAAFKELSGDIYFSQGENSKAFEAYALAREALETPSENLEMKYFNLLSN